MLTDSSEFEAELFECIKLLLPSVEVCRQQNGTLHTLLSLAALDHFVVAVAAAGPGANIACSIVSGSNEIVIASCILVLKISPRSIDDRWITFLQAIELNMRKKNASINIKQQLDQRLDRLRAYFKSEEQGER
jgi:tRNA/tmRNA/rRNA uracil-C5-methylase (TrmA/RlmC/RlmD family)